MSRRKSREQAFALLFEKSFNDLPIMDLAEGAQDARELIIEPFALELAQGAEEGLPQGAPTNSRDDEEYVQMDTSR